MPRWEPDARQRLETAALELYAERGYEATTVTDIADAAGVTPRTYFRYFPDKREVLFGNAVEIRDRMVSGLEAAPASRTPLLACLDAMKTCEELFRRREHRYLRRRNAVIESAVELQEREARKLASLSADVAVALAKRGAIPDDAQLVADLAIVVFAHASRLWMRDSKTLFGTAVDRAAALADSLLTLADDAVTTGGGSGLGGSGRGAPARDQGKHARGR